jgi:integrase
MSYGARGLRDELLVVLDSIYDGLKDASDRALLLIGFAEGFRRSELAGLNVEDIEPVRQGIIIHLRRPKTVQEGTGWKICIPFGRSRHCPVAAIEQRRTRSGITQGPLFRLSGEAVSLVIKERVAALESIRPVTRGTACEQDWRPAPLGPAGGKGPERHHRYRPATRPARPEGSGHSGTGGCRWRPYSRRWLEGCCSPGCPSCVKLPLLAMP